MHSRFRAEEEEAEAEKKAVWGVGATQIVSVQENKVAT